ncbi:hypothetical protein [Streptomyces sp. NPDC003032]
MRETTREARGKMRGVRDAWESMPDRPGWGRWRYTQFLPLPMVEQGGIARVTRSTA